MVTIVVGLNLSLALFCFGIAYQVNRWRRSLRRATYGLSVANRATTRVLAPAPQSILKGRTGTARLRHYATSIHLCQPHLEMLWTVLSLLCTVQRQPDWKGQRPLGKQGPQT